MHRQAIGPFGQVAKRMRGHAEILGCVDLNEQPIPEGQRYEIFICLNAYHFVQQKIPCYSAHNILNNVLAIQDAVTPFVVRV